MNKSDAKRIDPDVMKRKTGPNSAIKSINRRSVQGSLAADPANDTMGIERLRNRLLQDPNLTGLNTLTLIKLHDNLVGYIRKLMDEGHYVVAKQANDLDRFVRKEIERQTREIDRYKRYQTYGISTAEVIKRDNVLKDPLLIEFDKDTNTRKKELLSQQEHKKEIVRKKWERKARNQIYPLSRSVQILESEEKALLEVSDAKGAASIHGQINDYNDRMVKIRDHCDEKYFKEIERLNEYNKQEMKDFLRRRKLQRSRLESRINGIQVRPVDPLPRPRPITTEHANRTASSAKSSSQAKSRQTQATSVTSLVSKISTANKTALPSLYKNMNKLSMVNAAVQADLDADCYYGEEIYKSNKATSVLTQTSEGRESKRKSLSQKNALPESRIKTGVVKRTMNKHRKRSYSNSRSDADQVEAMYNEQSSPEFDYNTDKECSKSNSNNESFKDDEPHVDCKDGEKVFISDVEEHKIVKERHNGRKSNMSDKKLGDNGQYITEKEAKSGLPSVVKSKLSKNGVLESNSRNDENNVDNSINDFESQSSYEGKHDRTVSKNNKEILKDENNLDKTSNLKEKNSNLYNEHNKSRHEDEDSKTYNSNKLDSRNNDNDLSLKSENGRLKDIKKSDEPNESHISNKSNKSSELESKNNNDNDLNFISDKEELKDIKKSDEPNESHISNKQDELESKNDNNNDLNYKSDEEELKDIEKSIEPNESHISNKSNKSNELESKNDNNMNDKVELEDTKRSDESNELVSKNINNNDLNFRSDNKELEDDKKGDKSDISKHLNIELPSEMKGNGEKYLEDKQKRRVSEDPKSDLDKLSYNLNSETDNGVLPMKESKDEKSVHDTCSAENDSFEHSHSGSSSYYYTYGESSVASDLSNPDTVNISDTAVKNVAEASHMSASTTEVPIKEGNLDDNGDVGEVKDVVSKTLLESESNKLPEESKENEPSSSVDDHKTDEKTSDILDEAVKSSQYLQGFLLDAGDIPGNDPPEHEPTLLHRFSSAEPLSDGDMSCISKRSAEAFDSDPTPVKPPKINDELLLEDSISQDLVKMYLEDIFATLRPFKAIDTNNKSDCNSCLERDGNFSQSIEFKTTDEELEREALDFDSDDSLKSIFYIQNKNISCYNHYIVEQGPIKLGRSMGHKIQNLLKPYKGLKIFFCEIKGPINVQPEDPELYTNIDYDHNYYTEKAAIALSDEVPKETV